MIGSFCCDSRLGGRLGATPSRRGCAGSAPLLSIGMDASPLEFPASRSQRGFRPPGSGSCCADEGVPWPDELARAHHRRSRDLPWKSLHHRHPSARDRNTRQRGGRSECGGDRTELPFDHPGFSDGRPCATPRNWRRSGWWPSPDEVAAMRFKPDENLPGDFASLLRRSGHDAVTVLDQGLGGARDPELASVCSEEGRVLVTFDTVSPTSARILRRPTPESSS